jgi:hypothetical protein
MEEKPYPISLPPARARSAASRDDLLPFFGPPAPMLEPSLGLLPYANLALATATGLVLLVLPSVWGRKAEVPT